MRLRGGRGDLEDGHDELQVAVMIRLGSISLSLSLFLSFRVRYLSPLLLLWLSVSELRE